jgi:hypothetical protein
MVSPTAIVFLVASHIAAIPALVLTINYKGKFYIIDYTFVFWSFISSLLYHLSQVKLLNYNSVVFLEQIDNTLQYSTLTWFLLSEMGFPKNTTFALLINFVSFFILMSNYLVFTVALPFGAIILIVFVFAVRSLWYRIPIRHFSTSILIIFFVVTSIALSLFAIGGSPGDPHYIWAHGAWHFAAYIAMTVFLVLRYDPMWRLAFNLPLESDYIMMMQQNFKEGWQKHLRSRIENEKQDKDK